MELGVACSPIQFFIDPFGYYPPFMPRSSNSLFPSHILTKTLCVFLFPPKNYMCLIHLIIIWSPYQYWVRKLLNMQFSSVSWNSLLAPDIFLNTQFSNILSLCSSINMINHVSHRYATGTVSIGMTSHCDISSITMTHIGLFLPPCFDLWKANNHSEVLYWKYHYVIFNSLMTVFHKIQKM